MLKFIINVARSQLNSMHVPCIIHIGLRLINHSSTLTTTISPFADKKRPMGKKNQRVYTGTMLVCCIEFDQVVDKLDPGLVIFFVKWQAKLGSAQTDVSL